jgi:hypothetical protein
MAATLNKSNNTIYLIYGASVGQGDVSDIRAASYASGAWTAKTDVITNASVPSGTAIYNVSVAYDSANDVIYAGYTKSTSSPQQVYFKKSTDGMTTWSSEIGPFSSNADPTVGGFALNFLSPFKIFATWYSDTTDDIYGAILESDLSFGTHSSLTLTGNVKFAKDLTISGALAKGAGTFVIDHPMDPTKQLLYHSFVESPDAKNIYDGIATLDARGMATVTLPEYFEALNTDFRYQYLPLYTPMPGLHIKQEIQQNTFVIAGGVPYGEVSWQVTGNRHDPYIKANPIIPEVRKGPKEIVNRGKCLFEPLCY